MASVDFRQGGRQGAPRRVEKKSHPKKKDVSVVGDPVLVVRGSSLPGWSVSCVSTLAFYSSVG